MSLVEQLRLMVLTDAALLKGRDPVDVCRQAVRGGATMIQVRLKTAVGGGRAGVAGGLGGGRAMLELTRALVGALPVPVIVNDRADVAWIAKAAGVHLGWDDPPLDVLRPHAPPGFIFGLSVGSETEARRALALAPDYWSIGPCFSSETKPDAGAPLGPDGFARLARLAPRGMPVIGIGGITAENAGAIVKSGAIGVAVIGAVVGAKGPERAAREIRDGMVL
jgi:thiamine-phosphate pyrophosphorylase